MIEPCEVTPEPWMQKAAIRIFMEKDTLTADQMASVMVEEWRRDALSGLDHMEPIK